MGTSDVEVVAEPDVVDAENKDAVVIAASAAFATAGTVVVVGQTNAGKLDVVT